MRFRTGTVKRLGDNRMDRKEFKEALLQQMERKHHWAWPLFTSGRVGKDRLHIHLEQEYGTYVRDFPVLVGRAYVQCPIAEVRRELAENLYEEETGGLHAGRPHPELFLEYPRGLGMDLARFERIVLLPKAASFRRLLDQVTSSQGWARAAVATTIFLEGTAREREELEGTSTKPRDAPLEEHPLVKYYGLPLECMKLARVHRAVESGHRHAAWRIMLDYVPEDERKSVVEVLENAIDAWLAYRDEVALACGLQRLD